MNFGYLNIPTLCLSVLTFKGYYRSINKSGCEVGVSVPLGVASEFPRMRLALEIEVNRWSDAHTLWVALALSILQHTIHNTHDCRATARDTVSLPGVGPPHYERCFLSLRLSSLGVEKFPLISFPLMSIHVTSTVPVFVTSSAVKVLPTLLAADGARKDLVPGPSLVAMTKIPRPIFQEVDKWSSGDLEVSRVESEVWDKI
ncbi:hypothetical protein RRG08_049499 [Elysia crispata]|uniref:Uncharacterized protein n=1 Tax=Elysia crispata TaxID=231223 RepID=A0AAE1DEU8_9GAST|nr:hypothetical protein RRG08_049499 [Elysia crispata]